MMTMASANPTVQDTNVFGVEHAFFSDRQLRAWKMAPEMPPLFIEPVSPAQWSVSTFVEWARQDIETLKQLLVENGGVVFRGFPVADAEDFNRFVMLFEQYSKGYAGGASPRQKITGQVLEATRYTNEAKLALHSEMAYLKDYPGRIMFFCRKPAEDGGETTIGDMRRFTRLLPEDLRKKLELGGICIRNFVAPPPEGQAEFIDDYSDQRSWKYAFYTDKREEVEAICADKSMEPIWHDDGSLTVRNELDNFSIHPATGERIYRSQIHVMGRENVYEMTPEAKQRVEEMFKKQKIPSGYLLGDGSKLAAEDNKRLRALFDDVEIAWKWQAGDIMLLDNLLVAHGRNPFKGTRDVQVALLA